MSLWLNVLLSHLSSAERMRGIVQDGLQLVSHLLLYHCFHAAQLHSYHRAGFPHQLSEHVGTTRASAFSPAHHSKELTFRPQQIGRVSVAAQRSSAHIEGPESPQEEQSALSLPAGGITSVFSDPSSLLLRGSPRNVKVSTISTCSSCMVTGVGGTLFH